MRQNPNENQVKNKIKIEQSEYNPVPLYRSYGVKTKERPLLTKVKIIMQKAVATLALGVPISVIAIGVIALIFASGSLLLATAIVAPAVIFTLMKITKPTRKRLKLIGDLKKLCKKYGYKYGYKLELSDSPLSSKWSKGEGELVLYTNTKVYNVRMFAIRKYRSKLKFESENEMTVTVPPLRNKFAVIYDLKTKYKKLGFDFSNVVSVTGRETVKALIICPTCEEWSYKYSNSTYIPTGNAETVFGYKVYTASGFVSDLRRSEEIK